MVVWPKYERAPLLPQTHELSDENRPFITRHGRRPAVRQYDQGGWPSRLPVERVVQYALNRLVICSRLRDELHSRSRFFGIPAIQISHTRCRAEVGSIQASHIKLRRNRGPAEEVDYSMRVGSCTNPGDSWSVFAVQVRASWTVRGSSSCDVYRF